MNNNKFKYFMVKESGLSAIPVETGNFYIISDSEIPRIYADIDGNRILLASITDYYTKSEIDNIVSAVYKFKGSVETVEDLPKQNQSVGDVYNILSGKHAGANFAWDGKDWDKLSETIDLTPYLTKASAEETYETIVNVTTFKAALEELVATEELRAKGVEENLQANITAEETRAKGVEETLQANITAEETRAKGAEEALSGSISSEKLRAEGVESGLNTSISNETSRATEAEGELQANITAEETRAKGAEEELGTSIATEITRATEAEERVEGLITAEETRAKGVEEALESKIDAHSELVNNPHAVTKAQVGLGNVDNTSDADKPVSTATQAELDKKADKDTTYTKDEMDTALDGKQPVGSYTTLEDVYSKEEVDTKLSGKQPLGSYVTPDDIYTKEELDNKFSSKQPTGDYLVVGDVYSNSEIDTMLSGKQPTGDYITSEDIYSKEEIDTKLSGKQPIGSYLSIGDVYSNSEIDTKLSGKQPAGNYALQDNTYTKEEVDELVSGITPDFTEAQKAAINSGITAEKVTKYEGFGTSLSNHAEATNNPHSVTKAQVGLGNVDNTSDANKPISTATQAALDEKQNSLTTTQLSAVDSGITSSKVATYDGYATTISGKANSTDVYTKTEVDTELNKKASSENVYTKEEVNTELNKKANSSAVYTKTETDSAISTALSSYTNTADLETAFDALIQKLDDETTN